MTILTKILLLLLTCLWTYVLANFTIVVPHELKRIANALDKGEYTIKVLDTDDDTDKDA